VEDGGAGERAPQTRRRVGPEVIASVKVHARLGIVEVQRGRDDVGVRATCFPPESLQGLLQHVFLVDPGSCMNVRVRAHRVCEMIQLVATCECANTRAQTIGSITQSWEHQAMLPSSRPGPERCRVPQETL